MQNLVSSQIVAAFALASIVLASAILIAPERSESSGPSASQVRVSDAITDSGITALQAGEHADAIRLFEQAVAANPQNARAYSYMGHAYRQVGMIRRSYKYFSTALRINPNERTALNWSGQVDVVGENIPLAEEKLARLERLCGRTCPEYLKLKGAIEDGVESN